MVPCWKKLECRLCLCLLALVGLWAAPSLAEPVALSQGQLVYVPVYSHIFFGDRPQSFNLSVTLSIRNVDMTHPIEVTSVRYYDENGKLVRDVSPKRTTIAPFSSTRVFIKESDVSGGSEASFLVRWRSAQKVTPPLIYALMVGASFGQGISFSFPGRVLEEFAPEKSK